MLDKMFNYLRFATVHYFLQGLWIGLICGLSCQAATLLLVTLRSKWTKLDLPENSNRENPVSV